MKVFISILQVAIALFGLAIAGEALAQSNYPTKPVRFIVPFVPGGAADATGRLVGQELAKTFGQQFLIENRGGGGGTIGVGAGVKSAPDGYTIFLATTASVAINPKFMAKPPYDSVRDIAPVSLLAISPLAIVVPISSPIKTMQDLISAARANPGGIGYGTAGTGTPHHLAGELLNQMYGIKLTHVPYKGSGPAAADLVAGQIPLAIIDTTSIVNQVRNGRARALATLEAKRTAVAPEIQSMAEAGVPNFDIAGWFMLGAPAGTPRDIIAKLNHEVVRILALPAIREKFIAAGVEARSKSPEEMVVFIQEQVEKWGRLFKASGATLE